KRLTVVSTLAQRGKRQQRPLYSFIRGPVPRSAFSSRGATCRHLRHLYAHGYSSSARERSRYTMLVAELQELEEVKNLMNRGQQLGVLTFGDIASAVSEVDLDESDVEDLYGHLEKAGIELVEDMDPAQKAAAEAMPVDTGKKGRRRQK